MATRRSAAKAAAKAARDSHGKLKKPAGKCGYADCQCKEPCERISEDDHRAE